MEYRDFLGFRISVLGLGTWAFGSDKWWGPQSDEDSFAVLEEAVKAGINLIDTAPVYGRGHSEEIVGEFLKKEKIRERIVLATKVGLSWEGKRICRNLKRERMLEEIDASRRRLKTDYIDIYQVHWPDPNTPLKETAETMYEFYRKKIIKAIGVSNFSVKEMKEFMKYSPLHFLQPPYNMFRRECEEEIIPFCIENNIGILGYIPLHSGILTGKFFFENVKIPSDLCRKNHIDLKEPRFSINKETLAKIKKIAEKYKKTLTQFVLNWTYHQKGIVSILVGARNKRQIKENLESVGWQIEKEDYDRIEEILSLREELLHKGK